MSDEFLLFLFLQAVAFLIWAVLSFRAIFQIRAVAAARTGSGLPGPVSFLSAARVWARDPATRNTRIWWAGCLAVLFLAAYFGARVPAPIY